MSCLFQSIRGCLLFVVIGLTIIINGLIGVYFVSAQTPPVGIPSSIEMTGYAWSSNIGWISLNCKTGGATGNDICSTSNYQVKLNPTGELIGYAWSSNIGWIRFGGLSKFPTAPGNSAVNASMTGTYPNLTFNGWARACAGMLGNGCSSAGKSLTAGSWDGWISLKGSNYGVSTAKFGTPQYVWGSDVVGWVDMSSRASWDAPRATITGTSCMILTGQSECSGKISWVTNPTTVSNPNIYRLVPSPTQLSAQRVGVGVPVILKHGANIFLARTGTTELSRLLLTVSCESGQVMNAGICPNPPPTITIKAERPVVRIGQTVTITWTITNLLDGTCTLSGTGLTGTVTTSGNRSSGPINNYNKFGISCTGSFGTVTAKDAVEVVPSAQEI